jgi:hypothetical protein
MLNTPELIALLVRFDVDLDPECDVAALAKDIGAALPSVLPAFTAAGWEEDRVILWLITTNGFLGGHEPLDALTEDPEAVAAAVQRQIASHS